MNPSLRLLPALILCLCAAHGARAAGDSFEAPDSLVLKNGRTVRGLIIKNSRDAVLLQEKSGETSYPKSEIVRIRDEANTKAMFTGISRKGGLPPWRVIANDLRTHDEIKSLVEIPLTAVDTGEFKNVPYMSFRANNDIELDIYGDPEDPAGFEIGIFGARSGSDKLRKVIRAFLAGFLATRDEIGALYSLSLNGGIRTVGDLTIEITPKTAPDAYGAWWISLYNRKALAKVRLTDAAYAKITRPQSQVVDKNGRVLAGVPLNNQVTLSEKMHAVEDSAKMMFRGFYRDKNGDFRFYTQTAPAAARTN